jgi:putative drug exporter of the RND superfamily
VFEKLGRWCARHPWPVVAAWIVLFLLSVPALLNLEHALKVGGFSDDSSEAAKAGDLLQQRLGFSANVLQVVLTSPTLNPNDPRFVALAHQALAKVADDPDVKQIIWHTDNFRQVGRDGHTAYELVVLDPTIDPGTAVVNGVKARLQPTSLRVLVGGAPAFYTDIESASASDLHRAEFIAFPFAAIALVLVFRTLVAALVPVIIGGLGVSVAAGVIYLVAQVTDMSIFVLNVATMIGLGLGVDYSLFITSRFREELGAGPPGTAASGRQVVQNAVATTAATAGRAVFFSGSTVCLGLLALLSFNFMLLRSVGLGGCIVVLCTVLSALTLLPAVLALLGPRIDALPVLPRSRGVTIFWERLAHAVMRRPWAFGVPSLALLLFLGLPFLHVRLSSPDASILPQSVASRQAFDVLNAEFPPGDGTPIIVAVTLPADAMAPASLAELYAFTHRISADPRVARVDSVTTIDPRLTLAQYQLLYADPQRVPDYFAAATAAASVKGNTAMVQVYSKYSSIDPRSQALVLAIRDMSPGPGATMLVGGVTAAIHDVVGELYQQFPRALLFIVLSTYTVLFILFRSAFLPLKAIVMNSLSIIASYGALVFVFQDGHLTSLLGFTKLGYVEAELPILMFCTLFGISMDYEVFLLSRIKEAYDRTGDNTRSVAEGMHRSGRIITSAALIVVLVSGSFLAASIVLIKALGLGVALAVFLDATVVRALLVPATMRLLGDWNWWLPPALRTMLPSVAGKRAVRSEG